MKNDILRIIENVRKNGDKALSFYTRKFDGLTLNPGKFAVSRKEIESSVKRVEPATKKAILGSARNIETFHKLELTKVSKTWFSRNNGKVLGQIIRPVESAGIYIPGGKYAIYPSVVLMTAIPARVAGVRSIIMVTPPGNIKPEVLFAAKVARVDEIYRVGGPQGIAALAFGTKTIPKVDLIAGPGSSYVTEAKRLLFGQVGIDMIAGPSEVVVICDESMPYDYITYDLLAQAEHSPETKVYVFCSSQKYIKEIETKLKKTILENKNNLPYLSLSKQFVLKCRSLPETIKEVNMIAPEHLQVMHGKAKEILKGIKNAGAIFVGIYSPVAVGDYYAGPSHVLPTGSTARFSSGLSVQTFLKKTSYIEYSRDFLKKDSADMASLAEIENLKMHKESVLLRFR